MCRPQEARHTGEPSPRCCDSSFSSSGSLSAASSPTPAAVIEPQQYEVMAVTPSYTLGWFAARMMPAEGQSSLRQFSKVFNEGLIMVLNEIPKWEVKAGEDSGSYCALI